MQRLLKQVLPFIYLGVMIVIFVVGFIFLSYLLIVGALVGLILFAIAWIRNRFYPQKLPVKHKKHGRTFDHE